jgi:hypothetical protein
MYSARGRPRRAFLALPALALLAAPLVSGPAAYAADADDLTASEAAGVCSTAEVVGTYAFHYHGRATKPDGSPAGEFAGVGTETFDGRGAISAGRLIGIQDGVPVTLPFTGAYAVGSDCTGTKTITFAGGPALHYALVVDRRGCWVETAATDPGVYLAFAQVRQDASCAAEIDRDAASS